VGQVRVPSAYRVQLKVVLGDGEVLSAEGETYGGSIGDALDNFEPETLDDRLREMADLTEDEKPDAKLMEIRVEKIS
jgi:hypothetical protein